MSFQETLQLHLLAVQRLTDVQARRQTTPTQTTPTTNQVLDLIF